MTLYRILNQAGLNRGPVYATRILKGHEAARMVADFKAQETIRAVHAVVLGEVNNE